MCMPTCTRYVRDMCAICMRQRGHFTLPLSRQRGTFSLSRTACMRQRGHFHSSTLKAARRHLGMSVCRRRRSAGLQRVRVCLVCVRVGGPCPVVLRPCGCGLCCHAVSDVCARPGTAPHHLLAAATREVALEPGGAGGLGALATSWRGGDDLGRPGHGALVALSSWPVAVRRRASPCSRRVSLDGASGACRSWRGVARRGMRRGE